MELSTLGLVIGLSAVMLFCNLTPWHDWGGDFASYIMQAQSILDGDMQGFVDRNRFTIENTPMPLAPVAYPWGFPLMLAPVYGIFGMDLLALKSVAVVCFIGFLLVLGFGMRRDHSWPGLIALVALFAFNPIFIDASNQILSDLPSLLTCTASILFIHRTLACGRPFLGAVADSILIGLSVTAALVVRSNAVAILPALAVAQAVVLLGPVIRECRGRPFSIHIWKASAFNHIRSLPRLQWLTLLLPHLVIALSLVLWNSIFPSPEGGYASHLRGTSLCTVYDNFHYYLNLGSGLFQPMPAAAVVWGASVPLALAGMILRARTHYVSILFVLISVTVLLIWPYTQGLRFVFVILPFYFSFVITALEAFVSSARGLARLGRVTICGTLLSLILIALISASVRQTRGTMVARSVGDGPFSDEAAVLFEFIKMHTPPASTIVFFKPRVMRLMTGRPSVAIGDASLIDRGDYLCVCLMQPEYERLGYQLPPQAVNSLERQGCLRRVFMNGAFLLFEVIEAEEEKWRSN